MHRDRTGEVGQTEVAGEVIRAFVPAPLPPAPPLNLGGEGQTLLERATLAVGRRASALPGNQVVSCVVGAGLLTALTVTDFVADRLTGTAREVISNFQLGSSFSVFDKSSFGVVEGGHFADFARGIISVTDIVFYISVTAVFLFVTVVLLESRRWL